MAPSSSQHVTVATIAEILDEVKKVGVLPARLRLCPKCHELFQLRCVRERAGSSDPDRLAFGLETVLKEALDALGDGPYGEAARLLFGAVAGARGIQLKRRRELAADELAVMVRTFGDRYENIVVRDVAAEVYRIEFFGPSQAAADAC